MSTAATMSAYKSPSHTYSHSHSRSFHSRPSMAPRGPASSSAAKAMSPLPPPHSFQPQPTQQPRSPSPSYFGLLVGGESDPPGSSAGQYARQNWENVSSQARSVAPAPAPAPAPRTVPVDANHEFEAFRRQSESNNFNLSHANLSAFARPSQSRQSTQSNFDSPVSPRTSHPTLTPSDEDMKGPTQVREGRAEPNGQSYFDVPRNKSPGPMSPRQLAVADHQHARLSLPSNRLQTPPIDTARKVQRADTLPLNLGKENPAMVTPEQLSVLMETLPREILLLDLRVFPHFASSRIRGALNLCIPTTLLKRPSFNVQKLADTFTTEKDQVDFARWRQCRYIILYDANSAQIKDASTSINVLKKFSSEGWTGQGVIIRGGFLAVSRVTPGAIDQSPAGQAGSAAKQVLSIEASGQNAVPVAGGCQMPPSKSAANPFFGNIRQNMDLLDGVGQMPIKRPTGFSDEAERRLPRWLRHVCSRDDQGKLASDKFLAIEKEEQKRMQQALSGHVSYGCSPTSEAPKPLQIAGIEKGSKNRYNNIFPYDHSRVRLQGEPAEGCDYVNANHVKASFSDKHYIATQAPIPATFNDFWRVVWEQDARVIVMLTAESEGGQVKSHPYWHAGTYGPLKLKHLSEKRVLLLPRKAGPTPTTVKRPSIGQRRSTAPVAAKDKKSPDHSPSCPTSDAPSVVVRQFTLSHSAYPFEPMREITQLHYSQWPDFGAPADPQLLLGLIEQTNQYAQRTGGSPPTTSPLPHAAAEKRRKVVVHCSAGCGRTGTFCTIDSVIDMLKRQRIARRSQAHDDGMDVDSEDDWLRRDDVDLIAQTVQDFRLQRLSMVQNLRQFVLCYETVLQWVVDDQLRT